MVFDFRYKDVKGHWKSSGHRKGLTRDACGVRKPDLGMKLAM
jgi:hypothetical protein